MLRSSRPILLLLAAASLLALILFLWGWRRDDLPSPGSARYEQVTRAFHVGLAALEVGLLEDAGLRFAEATDLAPGEPAAFANLGIARLRLGDFDGAEAPVSRAAELAPDNAHIAVLLARLEVARGRIDEGIAELRRAVALDPSDVRARFALAEELERSGAPDADAEAQALLDGIVAERPGNVAALLERARLAGRRDDLERLRESADRLAPLAAGWPPLAAEQYAALAAAASAGDAAGAARATAFLRNVLAPVPAFRESLLALRPPAELIIEPFDRFLVLAAPEVGPSPPDRTLTFLAEPLGSPAPARALHMFHPGGDAPPVTLASDERLVRRLDSGEAWPLPVSAGAAPRRGGVLTLDWNNDFRTDLLLAGSGGVRLLVQDEAGTFEDVTAAADAGAPVACDCTDAWAADIEMDGDLDVVLGVRDADPLLLLNRGDGTWEVRSIFPDVPDARAFVWADLDQDADPDAALLDAGGRLHVFVNRQAGEFVRVPAPAGRGIVALTVGDVNADGRLDLVTLDATGAIRRFTWRSEAAALEDLEWDEATLATWDAFPEAGAPIDAGVGGTAQPGAYQLLLADLDNNGALDLVASGAAGTRIWLADASYRFDALPAAPSAEVFAAVDLRGAGRLDLVGIDAARPVRLEARGEQAYHWMTVRARAQTAAGDQRINTFGVGGDVEVRSGLLTQKQVLTGTPVHFGLGARAGVDVVRIVWPNGVAQAEFDLAADHTIEAEQRLKGSCPWVFAWNGERVEFVTDFLWRSPLGLRINAQDTAGVTQTEDWIRIGADQLVPRDGVYDIRITAELWETHFFDHVSLMAVDAPADLELFVDERFAPARPPALAVQAVRDLRPVAVVRDDDGGEVTDLVERRDGRYLAAFRLGAYQGIAEEHTITIELAAPVPQDGRPVLVAHGWVYPTDSSINVAIGQGGHVRPQGLALEAQDASGQWVVIDADVGFPAGKHKTMLIDLRGAAGASRLRLRTNLEISWDWLATATVVEEEGLRATRLPASRAELRYRGFSQTHSPRGEAPETPMYDRLANTTQRWRDLEGYYTRFGDVLELIAGVDDRYVIMNAGDELLIEFDEVAPPPAGWRRVFVLIGDGWEKDGDYNTRFSQTVLPLPAHDDPAYDGGPDPLVLERNAVYQRYPGDWQRYHTRYVTPRDFVGGLQRHRTPGLEH